MLRSLDAMLARARGVKRKLEAAADEEARLHRQEEARVRHLAELYSMHDVEDVKYEVWSRTRLDRLLVDYLLRHGYNESARALADERGIQLLVDIDTFEQMNRIRKSLLRGSVTEALAWCTAGDTKKELRKINVCMFCLSSFLAPPPCLLPLACLRRIYQLTRRFPLFLFAE